MQELLVPSVHLYDDLGLLAITSKVTLTDEKTQNKALIKIAEQELVQQNSIPLFCYTGRFPVEPACPWGSRFACLSLA